MTTPPKTAADWTLREALVNALADLDSGRLKARHGILIVAEEVEGDRGESSRTRFWSATRDAPQAHGLLAIASHRMMGNLPNYRIWE